MSALAGLRVLDLARLLPGGFCSLLLADFGADVIKVEDTGMGDYVRADPPAFHALNRGKRAVSIDLKNPQGREAFLRMARDADVVLESFRPGVMDRLGVGYERLNQENPRLVYCAITGYGQDGPFAARAGHDTNYLARTGLLDLTGDPDGPPVQAAGQIADLGGGALMAAFGILAALRERDASGTGQLVDVSMTDGALSWLAMDAARLLAGGAAPERGRAPLAGGLICYRTYRCADGWVAFGALEPKFWRAWCDGVGRPELSDRQFEPVGSDIHREVEAAFAERTRAEWEAFNDEHDCCLEPVLGLDEALASELVRARGMVVEAGPDRLLGTPIKLSRTPADPARGGPARGADTNAVLAEAGYGADEIAALRDTGGSGVTFYEPLGDGRFRSTEHTRGPWDPAFQHAGPPAALLGRAIERCERRDDFVLARASFEILRAVPVAQVRVAARVVRPGRSVEMLEAELTVEDEPVMLARAWRVKAATAPDVNRDGPPPPRPDEPSPPPPGLDGFGYGRAVELRFAAGGWGQRRPATVWTRLLQPIVPDEEPTGVQRVLAVADSGNGVSAVLSWDEWLFINTELTVHFRRPPRGEWICLDAETSIAHGGAGLARSVLSDDDGVVAQGAQALLVTPRGA